MRCAVVEVYASWCGASVAMTNPLKNLHMGKVCEFKKLRLWKVCADLTKELAGEDGEGTGGDVLFKYRHEARPVFLFYVGGEQVTDPCLGVNVPGIDKVIGNYMPEGLLEEDDTAAAEEEEEAED